MTVTPFSRQLVESLKRGGHRVLSGRYPLYRYMVVGLAVGTIVQLIHGPPPSVRETVPDWVGIFYSIFQLVGAIILLAAIQYMADTPAAARLERIGLVMIMTAIPIYFISICINNNGIPETWTPYLTLPIFAYGIYRTSEVTKQLRELEKEKRRRGCEDK
ncbi:hypothetical protein SEA_FORZA_114 [Gordonia phage Forza]|uniref:Uncharacterized protein n=1 Tax=Gordonia phage Forza TaxID=2571247 RepID=A0A650EY65_9CAUD|nr:hypothetical protein PP303_gp114 [Gordonia phage Forza]QEM41581.1 hypothetical protein SEA_BOOPY_114 [Gordonia phage Boopy]QGT55107.1 hypothetical protein SEA_FORZA_114 [Gordonia phage Forza]UXE04255.1 membrane protein [Gordonia phage BlueNGold]WBF03895.1 hypothetical protein SEA_MAREELIH_112 [Gordonia phage Mareelih]